MDPSSLRMRHSITASENHDLAMKEHHDDEDNELPSKGLTPFDMEMLPLQSDDVIDEDDEILYPVKVDHGAASWHKTVEDWMYPPQLPRECQLLRIENLAVPACYLLVGILQGLSSPLINVFPLDLGATEAQQTSVSAIRGLPAAFKLVFGFISDTAPVCGYRRKPYMLMGWVMASLSMFFLMFWSNLSIPSRNAGCFKNSLSDAELNPDATSDTDSHIPSDAPSIALLSVALLAFGTGFWMADVMGDSIVAEKAKLEPPESRGSVQSSCYSYRFFGLMMAAPLSTYLYSAHGPSAVIYLLAVLPLSILPLVWLLHETQNVEVKSPHEQCGEIWNTVCSRAVWQPMGFVYLYNVLQVGNAAWREYLVTVLHFTSCQLNLILITAYILLYLGILAYKYFFIQWSWRKVYIVTTLLNGVFSVLQILLIMGITFGLGNFWFALGDDAFAEFIGGIQFLPTTIMMVHLCPTGSEGASYAMFTTVNNGAIALSSAFSTMLLGIWDVSRNALEAGQLTGMINLTYLTTAVQVFAIVFVGWLPNYKEDLAALTNDHMRSKIGGGIFLSVTLASILYAIVVGVLNIVAPGWMGET